MKRVYTKDVVDHVEQDVSVAGFVHLRRDHGKLIFIILRDVTGLVQVVFKESDSFFEEIKKVTTESVIFVKGVVQEEKQAPQGYEIHPTELYVLSISEAELPIPVAEEKGADETDSSKQYDYRWLSLRRPEQTKVFKVWTELERGFRDYWYENNFIQIYTPSFMSTASESGSEVFEVKYFDRKAYLAQSPQFYKQMAIASGFEKVFMVGPVFRAEPSFTSRHATEFTGWDFEMAFIDSHEDLMDSEESMFVAGFKRIQERFPELQVAIPTKPFPRISVREVKKRLQGIVESTNEFDINPEEEREIAKIMKEETGHDFVFITDYHKNIRPFYHMRHPDNLDYTKSADLLYKGIEVTTLAQREHRIDILEKQAVEKGMSLDDLKDYLNFFRFGCPPHGGGGIGAVRIVTKLLDLSNIREATFLPRDVKRLNP